jgi:GABA(A) receptor-associated protein
MNIVTTADFKTQHTFEERIEEARRIITKHPDRRPIICEKSSNTDLPSIDKKKYLVPYDLSIGQFIYVIRKRLSLKPEESLFLFINGKIMSCNMTIGKVYESEKNKDGFLYAQYTKEATFG